MCSRGAIIKLLERLLSEGRCCPLAVLRQLVTLFLIWLTFCQCDTSVGHRRLILLLASGGVVVDLFVCWNGLRAFVDIYLLFV